MNIGTISMGVRAPLIKEGDDIVNIVVDSVLNTVKETVTYNDVLFGEKERTIYNLCNKDIIGITESVVARSQGNYVSVDDIASWITSRYGNRNIIVVNPIYSRNRFAMILKGIARAANNEVGIVMPDYDEVGNPRGVNKFTGVNIEQYYIDLVQNEGKLCTISKNVNAYNRWCGWELPFGKDDFLIIYCGLHDYIARKEEFCPYDNFITLADIFNDKCEYGLLGSNKATEEKLKLFPRKEDLIIDGKLSKGSDTIVNEIKEKFKSITHTDIIVVVYGDGCFKDPVGKIWEFADPVSLVSYTDKEIIESTPNEIKLKAFIDDYKGDNLNEYIKNEIKAKPDLKGTMDSQGTTPRLFRDLIASLMDLTSGSGDKGTPIILVKNYFKNYSNDY